MERNYKTEEIHEYRDNLPAPRNAFAEYSGLERPWKAVAKENRLGSLAKVLKVCYINLHPKTYVLLKVLRTAAVESGECERSRIILKRLNTYLLASMGQNRLSALALMHINLDIDIDAKPVIKIFFEKGRALEFINICASKYSIM